MIRQIFLSLNLAIGVVCIVAGGVSVVQQEVVAQIWGHTDTICAWAHEDNRRLDCKISYYCVQTSNIDPAYDGYWREDDREESYEECFDFDNSDCTQVPGTRNCLVYNIYDAAGCDPSDYVGFGVITVPLCT